MRDFAEPVERDLGVVRVRLAQDQAADEPIQFDRERVARALQANAEKARQMRTLLPANRELLESLTPLRGVA